MTIDRPTERPIDQTTKRPNDRPNDRLNDRLNDQTTDQTIYQPTGRPTGRPTDRPTDHLPRPTYTNEKMRTPPMAAYFSSYCRPQMLRSVYIYFYFEVKAVVSNAQIALGVHIYVYSKSNAFVKTQGRCVSHGMRR